MEWHPLIFTSPVSYTHLDVYKRQVSGATATHTFASTNEAATVSFSMPFRVTGAPQSLTVVAQQAGFTFQDAALTVVRLGD